ncbi:hypothetical protein OIO90_004585 [Microbotryomycetes sp. JL221]|nr:hypothetical protein OIO90_004585 [Microbotryomycetes sp. JL221]
MAYHHSDVESDMSIDNVAADNDQEYHRVAIDVFLKDAEHLSTVAGYTAFPHHGHSQTEARIYERLCSLIQDMLDPRRPQLIAMSDDYIDSGKRRLLKRVVSKCTVDAAGVAEIRNVLSDESATASPLQHLLLLFAFRATVIFHTRSRKNSHTRSRKNFRTKATENLFDFITRPAPGRTWKSFDGTIEDLNAAFGKLQARGALAKACVLLFCAEYVTAVQRVEELLPSGRQWAASILHDEVLMDLTELNTSLVVSGTAPRLPSNLDLHRTIFLFDFAFHLLAFEDDSAANTAPAEANPLVCRPLAHEELTTHDWEQIRSAKQFYREDLRHRLKLLAGLREEVLNTGTTLFRAFKDICLEVHGEKGPMQHLLTTERPNRHSPASIVHRAAAHMWGEVERHNYSYIHHRYKFVLVQPLAEGDQQARQYFEKALNVAQRARAFVFACIYMYQYMDISMFNYDWTLISAFLNNPRYAFPLGEGEREASAAALATYSEDIRSLWRLVEDPEHAENSHIAVHVYKRFASLVHDLLDPSRPQLIVASQEYVDSVDRRRIKSLVLTATGSDAHADQALVSLLRGDSPLYNQLLLFALGAAVIFHRIKDPEEEAYRILAAQKLMGLIESPGDPKQKWSDVKVVEQELDKACGSLHRRSPLVKACVLVFWAEYITAVGRASELRRRREQWLANALHDEVMMDLTEINGMLIVVSRNPHQPTPLDLHRTIWTFDFAFHLLGPRSVNHERSTSYQHFFHEPMVTPGLDRAQHFYSGKLRPGLLALTNVKSGPLSKSFRNLCAKARGESGDMANFLKSNEDSPTSSAPALIVHRAAVHMWAQFDQGNNGHLSNRYTSALVRQLAGVEGLGTEFFEKNLNLAQRVRTFVFACCYMHHVSLCY